MYVPLFNGVEDEVEIRAMIAAARTLKEQQKTRSGGWSR